MRKVLIIIFISLFSLVLNSCGGGGGGGSEYFNTVIVNAQVASDDNPYESDLIVNIDTNSDNICDDTVIYSDHITIVADSVELPDNKFDASNVIFKDVTITYQPLNANTPPLETVKNFNLGQYVEPGSTVEFDIMLLDWDQKSYLNTFYTGNEFKYKVTLTFDAEEELTGKSKTITATMTLYVVDLVTDKCHF